jgi:RES domain-containing protein
MHLWRISSRRHHLLDGEGARLAGGRWKAPGRPVVYTSAQAALAVLEKLVWVDPEDIPDDLRLFQIELPDDIVPRVVEPDQLPKSWQQIGCPECAELGDHWLDSGTSLALSVPSAILPEERNVLLNPRHPDTHRLHILRTRSFTFEPRLLRLTPPGAT